MLSVRLGETSLKPANCSREPHAHHGRCADRKMWRSQSSPGLVKFSRNFFFDGNMLLPTGSFKKCGRIARLQSQRIKQHPKPPSHDRLSEAGRPKETKIRSNFGCLIFCFRQSRLGQLCMCASSGRTVCTLKTAQPRSFVGRFASKVTEILFIAPHSAFAASGFLKTST